MNYKLSIVIPVFNNASFTRSCLQDLIQLPEDHQLIVVDNGSTDETDEVLAASPRVKTVKLPENRGFAAACNEGYRQSEGECITFLNNDIRVKNHHQDWTQALIGGAGDGSLVGPTGGLLDASLNFITETQKYIESPYFYMSGWNLTALKSTFQKLDLSGEGEVFSLEFGLAFFEDTDLSFRAKQLGIPFKMIEVPVVHFGHMTAKKLNMSQLYQQARTKFVNKWLGKIKNDA